MTERVNIRELENAHLSLTCKYKSNTGEIFQASYDTDGAFVVSFLYHLDDVPLIGHQTLLTSNLKLPVIFVC